MQRLLIATNSRGKVAEFRSLLEHLHAEVVSPADLGLALDVAETGQSYADNATLKAVEFARHSGLLAMADDSGLEVEALGGAPGVFSSRYAGPDANDAKRNSLVLEQLTGVPAQRRAAQFVCVIAIATPDGATYLAEGACRGEIAERARGDHGFGYDPIFLIPELGKTMAEIPPEMKHRISHRARATRAALPILRRLLGDTAP